jgi:hypothetical protein
MKKIPATNMLHRPTSTLCISTKLPTQFLTNIASFTLKLIAECGYFAVTFALPEQGQRADIVLGINIKARVFFQNFRFELCGNKP